MQPQITGAVKIYTRAQPGRSYRTEDDAAFRIDREEDHHADDGDDDRGYDQVDEVAHTTLM